MITLNWNNRLQKVDARNYALESVGLRKSSLWLPGSGCLCIREAVKKGIVGRDSSVILVERSQSVIDLVKHYADNRLKNQNVVIHFGELSSLHLSSSLDYAFIDFMGGLNHSIVEWMKGELSQNLLPGATVCVTHSYGWRNNKFLDRVYAYCKSDGIVEWNNLVDQIGSDDRNIVLPLFLLNSSIKGTASISWPMKYQDSQRSMLLYKIENIQPESEFSFNSVVNKKMNLKQEYEASNIIQFFLERKKNAELLLEKYVKKRSIETGMAPNRIKAAIKAHITRRQMKNQILDNS